MVWIVKPSTVRGYMKANAAARKPLNEWLSVARRARWSSLNDVRKSFPSADEVKVKSGRMVAIFNIGGNNYRLIAAIHYNLNRIFILRFMSHTEYDKDQWKGQL